MSRLNFTPVNEAFTLGSSQIKDTQEEITALTRLILESNQNPKKVKPPNAKDKIGPPDTQTSVFRQPTAEDNIDYSLMKVIGHPKFKDIVKNYVMINNPEWLLKESIYVPTGKSTFGNKYQSTLCTKVQSYLIFFVVSVLIFLGLSIYL